MKIRVAASRTITLGTDPAGNITRIDNAIEKISDNLEAVKAELEGLEKQFEVAKEEVKKPFSKEQELKEKTETQKILNEQLNNLMPQIHISPFSAGNLLNDMV